MNHEMVGHQQFRNNDLTAFFLNTLLRGVVAEVGGACVAERTMRTKRSSALLTNMTAYRPRLPPFPPSGVTLAGPIA